MNLNVKFMISDIPTVLGALPVTLELTFASLFFAILIAVLFGICILKKIPVLKQLVIGLNTFIKGVPLIVQLLFCITRFPMCSGPLTVCWDIITIRNILPISALPL